MNVEEEIKKCEIYLKQIKQYDPDPFYVSYFFSEYINSINNIVNGIFEEANTDFGLFVSGKITQKKFFEKSTAKKDSNAIKFSKWFSLKYENEHEKSYPNLMDKIRQFKNKTKSLPQIKIMIRAANRYKNDFNQEIKINLTNGKIASREELDIEINRQTPRFLEIINAKRKKENEPKIKGGEIVPSAFLNIEESDEIEIMYASQIYMSVIRRLIEESRDKIKELSSWE